MRYFVRGMMLGACAVMMACGGIEQADEGLGSSELSTLKQGYAWDRDLDCVSVPGFQPSWQTVNLFCYFRDGTAGYRVTTWDTSGPQKRITQVSVLKFEDFSGKVGTGLNQSSGQSNYTVTLNDDLRMGKVNMDSYRWLDLWFTCSKPFYTKRTNPDPTGSNGDTGIGGMGPSDFNRYPPCD